MAFSGDFPGPAADPSVPQPETAEALSAGEAAPGPEAAVPDLPPAAPADLTSSGPSLSDQTPVEPSFSEAAPGEPEPAPTEASGEPRLAAIIEIPAAGSSEEGEADGGGEWEMLVSQVRDWLNNLKLQQTVQELRRPLSMLGWLLAVLLVLRIYGAVIGTIDRLPLVPGLLELVGVIAVGRFAATRLVRSQERQTLIRQLSDRWKAFRG